MSLRFVKEQGMHNVFWERMEMTPACRVADTDCLEMPTVAQCREPADPEVLAGFNGSSSTAMAGNRTKPRPAFKSNDLTESEYKSGVALRKVSGVKDRDGIIVMGSIDPGLAFHAFLSSFGFPPRSRPAADLLAFPTGRPLLNRKDETRVRVGGRRVLPMLVDGLRSVESACSKRKEIAEHSVTPGDKGNG